MSKKGKDGSAFPSFSRLPNKELNTKYPGFDSLNYEFESLFGNQQRDQERRDGKWKLEQEQHKKNLEKTMVSRKKLEVEKEELDFNERSIKFKKKQLRLQEIQLETETIKAQAEKDRIEQEAKIQALRLKNDLQEQEMRKRSLAIQEEQGK